MAWLFSAVYWLFLGTTSILLFLVALGIWALTAPFDPDRTLLHRYTCCWAQIYVRWLPGCRLCVEGRQKIAPRTPYVLVANHQSMTDIMALSALAVPFKWVSKKEAFRLPFIGWNMSLNRYVSVDRGNVRKVAKTLKACRHWLERRVPLLMFPEGHRSRTGELLKFHTGAFKLAADCGCAVVPVAVDGTLGIYRGARVSAFPGTIRIRVLDPITLDEAGGSVQRLRNLAQQRIAQALAEMRGRPAAEAPTGQRRGAM